MRQATQLPPGRHGLTREQVRASQRARMLEAMAAAVADRGYVGTPVAEVLRRAGVSRETFYEQFRSKEDCFLAAFDRAVEVLRDEVAAAVTDGAGELPGDPLERVDRALRAYLDALARERAYARTFLLEVHAAGPEVLRRRADVLDRFTALVAELVGARGERERFACEALVSATSSMVTMRLARDDAQGIRDLHAPLVALSRTLLRPEEER